MANALSNKAIKKRNAKIFKNIQDKLASDDEQVFVTAADKLSMFVSKKEAYYPEARPMIVNICQTAWATIRRLAKSDTTIHCVSNVPAELAVRAGAFVRLINTILPFASTFEDDSCSLRDDLKELFLSVASVVPQSQSPDTETKEQEGDPRSLHENDGGGERRGNVDPPQRAPEFSSSDQKPPIDDAAGGPTHPEQPSQSSGMLVPESNPSMPNPVPTSSTPLGPPDEGVETSTCSSTVSSSTRLSIIQTSSSTQNRELSLDASTPTTPTTPLAATRSSSRPVELQWPSSSASNATPASTPVKPAMGKSKKIKLRKTVPVDASLIKADLDWHESKQRTGSSEPGASASISLVCAGDSEKQVKEKNALPGPLTPGWGVAGRQNTTSPVVDVPQRTPSSDAVRPKPEERPASRTSGDSSTKSFEEPQFGTSATIRSLVPLTQSKVTSGTNAHQVSSLKRDETTPNNSDQRSIPISTFNSDTIAFPHVDFGRDAGNKLILRCHLTSEQRQSLSLWQTRDEHDRDVSTSICISLASYKASEAIAAGFSVANVGIEGKSALLGLTSSWPTNARLSADIGSFRMFLAPPLLVTEENFVDISAYITERHVEVHLDHAGDMKDYIFALAVHPPTPSQLRELEDQRDEIRRWRTALSSFRITASDLFG